MKSLTISGQAKKDLRSIWTYTVKQWAVEQADKYYNFIFAEIYKLQLGTNTGRLLDEGKEYFVTRVKSHYIVFRSLPAEIVIVSIIHVKRNMQRRLRML